MKRLLIDMDGTLARFYDQAKCIEKMYEPGFFSGLYPYENMIEAVKLLLKRENSNYKSKKKNNKNIIDIILLMIIQVIQEIELIILQIVTILIILKEDKIF